jgi:tetratricopeptide (TPR) repeat protein
MAKLESLLNAASPDVRGSVRLTALKYLMAEKKVEPGALMDKLRPVLATSGDDWGFISQCVDLLEAYERYGEARGLLEKWMEARQGSKAFEMVFARTALAQIYQAEGNATAAWNAVRPAVESWQWGALRRAALLSLELGKPEQALQLAQAASSRYPGSKSLSLLAEVHWRTGRPEEAAEALAQPERSVRLMDWRWRIGERFAAVFASRPVEEGLKAFQALQEKKIGATEMSQLAVEVNKAGNPALAFEMQTRLRAPGLQQLEFLMSAHGYMKQLKGEQAALDWLRATVPERMREPLSMFAFADREDAVLWEAIPLSDGTDENTDYVWLMRAAASLRTQARTEAHQRALDQRFSVDRPGYYHQLGRHLLGLIPQEAAIAAATTPKSREELPFFLGLKAQAEGRYEDAVTWYRNSVETGNPRNGEYRWAMNELYRLKQAELSLALLKQRAI